MQFFIKHKLASHFSATVFNNEVFFIWETRLLPHPN